MTFSMTDGLRSAATGGGDCLAGPDLKHDGAEPNNKGLRSQEVEQLSQCVCVCSLATVLAVQHRAGGGKNNLFRLYIAVSFC